MIYYLLPPKAHLVVTRYEDNETANNYLKAKRNIISAYLSAYEHEIICIDDFELNSIYANYCIISEDELDPTQVLVDTILKSEFSGNLLIMDQLITLRTMIQSKCSAPVFISFDLYYGANNPQHNNKLYDSILIYNEVKNSWSKTPVIVSTQNPQALTKEFLDLVKYNNDYFIPKEGKYLDEILFLVNKFSQ